MLVFYRGIGRNIYIEAVAKKYNIGFDNLRKTGESAMVHRL